MRRATTIAFVVFACALSPNTTSALSIDLNDLVYVPPNDPINIVSINVMTDTIGNDSDTSNVSGTLTAKLDFDLLGTTVQPTGIELTGGQTNFSDTSFSFLFGAITASSTELAGVPDTLSPPSIVTDGNFPASDHTFLLNQGFLEAAGQSIDLSSDPFLATGVGTGELTVVSNGPPVGNDYSFKATITLPVSFDEPFTVTNVPIVNTVNGSFSGAGTLRATQDFTLTIVVGDYDSSGSLDCEDLTLLEQAVGSGSSDLTFDANGDGMVNGADELFWINDLRQATPGDANLDDLVDGSDFVRWNANKFQLGTGWCSGDWNHDNQTDGPDFVLWNANKFNSNAPVAVPEPGLWWSLVTILALPFSMFCRKRC